MFSFTALQSSQLHVYGNRRPPAKTGQIGFLHLPDETRNSIYELVIHNHDRDVVFLPRELPRKVTPETDAGLSYCLEEADPVSSREYDATFPLDIEQPYVRNHNFGKWVDDHDLLGVVSEPASEASRASSDDGERCLSDEEIHRLVYATDEVWVWVDSVSCVTCNCNPTPWHEAHNGAFDSYSGLNENAHDLRDSEELLGDVDELEDNIDWAEDGGCDCDCHDKSEERIDNEECGGLLMIECPCHHNVIMTAPDDCILGSCGDQGCSHCAGHGLTYCTDYACSPHEGGNDNDHDLDDMHEEDDEHYDSEELIGMRYELWEPAILLVSTEIRAACIPVYYAYNAFSWRFFWLGYGRSLQRFKHWANDCVGDNAKCIRTLSMEGRHCVEEGVNFGAVITLTQTSPYFSVDVTEDDTSVEGIIREALGRELCAEMR